MLSHQTDKGGIVGLAYSDFDKRQRSGIWNIDDHSEDVNYIRSGETPNNYLLIGCHNTNALYVYDVFFRNRVSTSLFNLTGSITAIAYNKYRNIFAVASNFSPYLRIFSSENFQEILLPKSHTKPIVCLKFTTFGDRLFVGNSQPNGDNYLDVYETTNFTRQADRAAIKLNYLPTSISFNNNDQYLAIGHYADINNQNNNIKIYEKSNTNATHYINVNEYNIDSVDIGTVKDLHFINTDKDVLLLILGNSEPYLFFYNFNRRDLIYDYNEQINNLLQNKVNCLTSMNYGKKFILGCNHAPYLQEFDLEQKKITPIAYTGIDDSVTSVSMSYSDKYLVATTRELTPVHLFTYNTYTAISIPLNQQPMEPALNSCFVLGPVTSYQMIDKPKYSISSNDETVVTVNREYELLYNGVFYINSILGVPEDLAAHKNIFQTTVYKSLDFNNTYITSITVDGNLITNDDNIKNNYYYPNNYFNNIIKVVSYYSRIALLDLYNSVQILKNNNFTYFEKLIIANQMNNNIIDISLGYSILLGITKDNKVISSNVELFNPDDYPNLPLITQTSAGRAHIALLTDSKQVLCYGDNTYNQCDTQYWEDVQLVCCGDYFTIGLTVDGLIKVTGDLPQEIITQLVQELEIDHIATGPTTIILVRKNGIVSGYNTNLNFNNFFNIGFES